MIAKVITLYLQTIEGTLKGFHTVLLNLLKKLGIDTEELPKPEIIDEEKFAKNAKNIWLLIIPVGLVSAFCAFFPAWKSIGMIPIALFLTTLMAIMANQWADIDLEADNKKLIRTAKGKRKLYQLVSFGLTIWLVWTAYSVIFPNSAEATWNGIMDYVEGDSIATAKPLYVLPVASTTDLYQTVAGPIKQNNAHKKAVQDSIRKTKRDSLKETLKDSSITKEGRMVTFTEKQLQLVPPGVVEWEKSECLKDVFIRMEINDNKKPFILINNAATNDSQKRQGVMRINISSPPSKVSFYTPDSRYLKVMLTKLADGIVIVKIEEIQNESKRNRKIN